MRTVQQWMGEVMLHEAGLLEASQAVSYTHLRAHETVLDLVCRLLLEKKTKIINNKQHDIRHNTIRR